MTTRDVRPQHQVFSLSHGLRGSNTRLPALGRPDAEQEGEVGGQELSGEGVHLLVHGAGQRRLVASPRGTKCEARAGFC